MANWRFCFDTSKIQLAKYSRCACDSSNGTLSFPPNTLCWQIANLYNPFSLLLSTLLSPSPLLSLPLSPSPPDPLRPLWPSLGILGSFLLTALFIAGGALVDKIRGKKASDDDDGVCVCVVCECARLLVCRLTD